MTSRGVSAWARPALVGVLAFAVYLPSLPNGFALDDVVAIERDARIQHLENVPKLLVSPYLTYMPRERSPYRPLTTISYAVSWAMGGGHPGAFHATNVAFHVVATLLLLSLLTTLGAPALPAAFAAAVFAVHPVHVEAVAGIVGRADVLSTIFILMALRLHLAVEIRPAVRVLGVSLAYLFALGAKEGAVVLPLLLLVLEAIRPATRRAKEEMGPVLARLLSTWPTMAGMSVALAMFLLARKAVLGGVLHLDVAAYIAALPTSLRVTTAIANLTEVARLLVFPLDLTPEYGPSVIMPAGIGDMRFWLGVATLCGFLALIGYGMRLGNLVGRWLVAGLLWIGVSYLLLSNLLLPLPMWIAERTLYLPSVGLTVLLVGVFSAIPTKRPSRPHPAHIALISALVLAGVHSARHSLIWKNDEALFADLVERHPESFRAQWWVGGRMVDAGQVEDGLVWLASAFELNANSVLLRLDYVRALLLTDRSVEAEALVRPIAPFLHPSQAVFLAQSLIFQDRTSEAIDAVRTGLEYFPDEPRLIEQARLLGIGG